MSSATRTELGWTVTRVTFGLCFAFFHGYGKVFGGKMEKFTQGVASLGFPFPEFFAWCAGLTEFFGGLLIAVGLATRPAAALSAFTMMVAMYRHRADGIASMESAMLFFAVFVFALLHGGGRWSLDRVLNVRMPLSTKMKRAA